VEFKVNIFSFFQFKPIFTLIIVAALLVLAKPDEVSAQGINPDCIGSANVFDNSQLDGGNDCLREPKFYGIEMFEIAMCRSAPAVPTTTSTINLIDCDIIFSSAVGSQIQVKVGESTNVPGTARRPDNGIYTHAYILISNRFRIRHSQQMSRITTADIGSGIFCFTLTKTVSSADDTPDRNQCAATAPTEAQIGTITDVIDDFDTNLFSFTDGVITAFITNNAGLLLGSGEQAQASKLIGVQPFATPIVITENSSVINIAFKVSRGMTVGFSNTDRLESFGSGPFSVSISVR
jgi:hypothetical protein